VSLLVLLTAGLLWAACGDSEQQSAASDRSSEKPPAAPVETTATATRFVPLLAEVTPVPPGTSSTAGTVLGGADRRTAAALAAQLKGTALDQPGVSIYVFPIAGAGGSLLVLEMDAARGASFSGDALPLFKALVASDAARKAHIKQIAINYRGKDAQGPYIATMTLSMSVAEAYAKGTITQKDVSNQTPFEIKRGQQ
jgi:hypothetical protein